jgi:hypothetical protein
MRKWGFDWSNLIDGNAQPNLLSRWSLNGSRSTELLALAQLQATGYSLRTWPSASGGVSTCTARADGRACQTETSRSRGQRARTVPPGGPCVLYCCALCGGSAAGAALRESGSSAHSVLVAPPFCARFLRSTVRATYARRHFSVSEIMYVYHTHLVDVSN